MLILSGCILQHPVVTKVASSLANSNSSDDSVLSGLPQSFVCLSNMITEADVVQEAAIPEFGGMLESFKCRFGSNVVLIGSRNKTLKFSEISSPTRWSDESDKVLKCIC